MVSTLTTSNKIARILLTFIIRQTSSQQNIKERIALPIKMMCKSCSKNPMAQVTHSSLVLEMVVPKANHEEQEDMQVNNLKTIQ